MNPSLLLPLATLLLASQANAQTNNTGYNVVGSVIFGRHNDREAKPATYLTPLGAENQFRVGQFYRERYFGRDSSNNKVDVETTIKGLNADGYYAYGQIYGETNQNNVLVSSHYSFLQGLYPPTTISSSSELYNETLALLANGSSIENPLDGYQYVDTNVEQDLTANSIWLKGDTNCPALSHAIKSVSKSDLYSRYVNESSEFLQSLYSIDFIKETFKQEELNFTYAMNIFDEVTVNTIHNTSIAKQFNESIYNQIQYWSDLYQWTLSDKTLNANLTIGAQTLVSKIHQQLNSTLHHQTPYLSYLTGSFNIMYQLSSVLGLYTQDARFKTMPAYGATYVFELLSDSSNDNFVRFSFKNGTYEMGNELTSYALFNTSDIVMSWSDFESKAQEASLSSVANWCNACGYSDLDTEDVIGICVPSSPLYESAVRLQTEGVDLDSVSTSSKSSSSLSLADAGGIGAGTTIGVFLILGALFFAHKKLSSKDKKGPILPTHADEVSTNVGSLTTKESKNLSF